MTLLSHSPLGRLVPLPERPDAAILFPIVRAELRVLLGIGGDLPFAGTDLWTAYELCWLESNGKPAVGVAEIEVPADSPAIVESKSLKLYLGTFASESFASVAGLACVLETDLARACGAPIQVRLSPLGAIGDRRPSAMPGESLDAETLVGVASDVAPGLLACTEGYAEETLHSALFRSVCPVTGQPDLADVMIRYAGRRIDRAALLSYLVSFRRHPSFHEFCVERMFVDIAERCRPQRLTVYARFTRRGGIDINPFRSNFEAAPIQPPRTIRQ